MMDRTDRHFRFLMRLLAPKARLYTEMVTTGALLKGDTRRWLSFSDCEHPVALQLGGNDARSLAKAARIGADAGFDEINLNVGCPSGRVQRGEFGAALMRQPRRVADCIASMRASVSIPVTVKTRIGVDSEDSYEFLHRFVETISNAGCRTLILHARKALLNGLSPKENRTVPPLNYERVYRIKSDFPKLSVVINGGLNEHAQIEMQLGRVDGVMIGRAAYDTPILVAELDRIINGVDSEIPDRTQVAYRYLDYLKKQLYRGTHLRLAARHLMGLYANQPGARVWRRGLSALTDGLQGLKELSRLIQERPVLQRSA